MPWTMMESNMAALPASRGKMLGILWEPGHAQDLHRNEVSQVHSSRVLLGACCCCDR